MWQSDLAVSHYKLAGLAQQRGDHLSLAAEQRQCFAVLAAMESRGVHFDPALQHIYEQVPGVFGG